MYIISINFIGAFPEGDKIVSISSPNGGGGGYHLYVDKYYWGVINEFLGGWRVCFQNSNPEYSAGDLQPLIDMVVPENNFKNNIVT